MERYKRDKCGVSWSLLRAKALFWAENMGLEAFKASSGWVDKTLKRHGIERINLHGEAMDMTEDERIRVMAPWKKELEELIEDKKNSPKCLYNADQTGLFFQKLPNSLYVEKCRAKDYAGVKQMKDKTRITMMVCTAADGTRQPVAVVGKAKKPRCFDLLPPGSKLPLPYKSQRNAWFDKEVTTWWINNVFWPEHVRIHGYVNCILILDNCSAHNLDYSIFSPRLTVKFLPPNVTSMHQPADMGMIAALKVGYKAKYLKGLLNVFDAPGGFVEANVLRQGQRAGCRGVEYGGKPHILDAMLMVDEIWRGQTGKYISDESIKRCWSKASILPAVWESDINNDVGSASSSNKSKTICDEECVQLCDLMMNLKVHANETGVGTDIDNGVVFNNSFITEGEFSKGEMHAMVRNWVDIEDNQEMIDCIVDDELDIVERGEEFIESDDEEGGMVEQPVSSSPVQKVSYLEATDAMSTLDSYISTCASAPEISKSLRSLRWMLQKDYMSRPRCSPTITNFFSANKS